MRIFFDTEFTDLAKDAELISAGFITENGKEFYFERTDFDQKKPSDFVKAKVFPLLDAPLERRWGAQECCSRLVDWLEEQDSNIVLLSDSHWDSELLHEIFAIHGGIKNLFPNLKYELLHFEFGGWDRVFDIGYKEYFKQNPGKEHHALHDAKALRQGWMRMHGYY